MSTDPEKIDKYIVLGELGRGAMAVYKARDPVLDRLVAIEMMSEELLIAEEYGFARATSSARRHASSVCLRDSTSF